MCVCLLGDVLGKRGKMVKIGENRLWEAFCPLHMHTITQAAVRARPQAVIPQPSVCVCVPWLGGCSFLLISLCYV